MKRKIALVVGSTFLCASILSGCASATPVDKYLRSFDKGDSEAASQIYSEEIKDNAEDKEALQTKLKERMDSIYENFKSGKITSDEAKEKLKSYKEYDTSSVYAFTTINKVTTLQKSKDAYSDAEKAENDGNLADAITNYKSVIEDDPNHETAQAKVLQLSETYTETMKAQAQQEADSSSTTPYTKTYCADDDPFKTSYYTGYYINTTNPALYHNGSGLKYTIDMDSFGNYYASGRNLDETFLSADEIANAVYKDYSYFEICWYNFTIADFRVTKAEVIFMDGSKTVVSGNSVYSPYFKHDLDNKPFTTQVNQYSDVYNYKDYLNYNPDLNEVLGNNQRALFEHFISFGMKEGRQGSSEFNLDAYKANNPDLVAAFGDDNVKYYEHYISSGKAEGRKAT